MQLGARVGAGDLVRKDVDEVPVRDDLQAIAATEVLGRQLRGVAAVGDDDVGMLPHEEAGGAVDIGEGSLVRVEVVQRPHDAVSQVARVGQIGGEIVVALLRGGAVILAVKLMQPVEVEDAVLAVMAVEPCPREGVVAQFQLNAVPVQGEREQAGIRVAPMRQGQAADVLPEEEHLHDSPSPSSM